MKVAKILLYVSLVVSILILTVFSSSVYYLTINRNRVYEMAKEVISYGEVDDLRTHARVSKVECDGTFEIWKYTPQAVQTDRAIFMVPGGAYLTCQPNVQTLDALQLPYVVYLITYPVLPAPFDVTLTAIVQAFTYLLNTVTVKVTVISISAGSLLSVLAINRIKHEAIDQLITISGYFGSASVSDYLVKFADLFWLRGPLTKPINAEPVPSNIQLLILASSDDKRLGDSSSFFAALNATHVIWFEGGHDFWNRHSAPSTLKAYDKVRKFIQDA